MSSQVIYGSWARQDNDSFSDKDIGIFCDELSQVDNELKTLTNEGWSCAVYTYERFQNMANLGLLFVQHIKQDGIVVVDENNKLGTILNSFTPKSTYSTEIEQALKLINIIPGIAPDINCIFWALDIVSVAIRNFCIAYYANKKTFVFSTYKLYEMLAKDFNLSDDDFNALCFLRNAKYMYRNKIYTHEDLDKNISFFLYLTNLLDKLHIKHKFSICTKTNFMDSAKNMILSESMPGYYRLRLAEILFNTNSYRLSGSVKKQYSNLINFPHVDPYTLSSRMLFKNTFNDLLSEVM